MRDQMTFAIDLPATNDWNNIELLRGGVQSCLAAIFGRDEESHAVGMVVGELLENAVKYGAWGEDARFFHLRVWSESGRTRVSVASPMRSAEDPDVRRVVDTIAWIKSFRSSEEAYAAKLLEVASRPRPQKMSQLGLVRIAYEGDCTLHAEVHADALRVTATLRSGAKSEEA